MEDHIRMKYTSYECDQLSPFSGCLRHANDAHALTWKQARKISDCSGPMLTLGSHLVHAYMRYNNKLGWKRKLPHLKRNCTARQMEQFTWITTAMIAVISPRQSCCSLHRLLSFSFGTVPADSTLETMSVCILCFFLGIFSLFPTYTITFYKN